MLDFPVVLSAQPEGGFVVTFPDVPEAITQGEDEEEALLYAVDALETALSFYVDARKNLPLASRPKRGQRTVRPSALEGAKLGVYQAMTEQGIKKAELARRLGCTCPKWTGSLTCATPRGLTKLKPRRACLEDSSRCG